MHLKKIVCGILGFVHISSYAATPPLEVITACKEERSISNIALYNPLDRLADIDDYNEQCYSKYEVGTDDEKFAYLNCTDNNIFILNNRQLTADSATNFSVHPGVAPGTLVASSSTWAKIIFDKKDYLCVSSPISENGKGQVQYQYYIIENAFNNAPPEMSYLFFDKPNDNNN